jgi:branched-chain amino acid transport system substrate-binding protein
MNASRSTVAMNVLSLGSAADYALGPTGGSVVGSTVDSSVRCAPLASKFAALKFATFTLALSLATFTFGVQTAHAQTKTAASTTAAPKLTGTIKIGEINSYKAQPAFLEPYKKGIELAVEEINAAGGVLGKKLEIVHRDDNANPGDAVRVAEELLSREQVVMLTGTFLSNIGLAVTDFAKQRKVVFLASEPLTDKITWQNGNRYTFRLRPNTYMQASMLVPEAVKLKKKRWAIVYPNYEYGQSAAATFKQLMKAAQPDVEFVAEQAAPLGKVDAGAVAQALADAKPDAIFNVLFGADLAKFVREGNTRGLFKGRQVVSLLSGEPEYLDPLKDEAPVGWIVTGYPWQGIQTPEHKSFFVAYYKRYNDNPRLGSVVGYATIKSIAAALNKAKSTDTEKVIAAFKNLPVSSPFGPIIYRAQDNQATMGAFVGRIGLEGGKGIMKDYYYVDGAKVLPSDAEVAKLRPAK